MGSRKNSEGYVDLTAYYALAEVEKEERKKHKRKRKAEPEKITQDLACNGEEGEAHEGTGDCLWKQLHGEEVVEQDHGHGTAL